MKFNLLYCLLLVSALFMIGCGEDEDDFCADRLTLDEYIAENEPAGDIIEHESGLRYVILDPGTAERPLLTSLMTINYEGKLTNGNVFDSGTNARFILGELIQGWQIGLREIGAGGRILLYIPPSLGYGPRQAGRICPNSDLVFEVTTIQWIDN